MTATPGTARLDLYLDEPVPYTLTPLGYVALAFDELRAVEAVPLVDEPDPDDEWACLVCGAAWFGPVPDDGQCHDCRDDS
jgi:hypothetical protein